MGRRRINPGDRVRVKLRVRDRELLLEHTPAGPEYAERLQPVPGGSGLVGEYTLDDLEDMLGYIAAEANHTEEAKLQKELDCPRPT